MRLSRARREVYPHKDVAALRAILADAVAHGHPETGEPYRLILVVTDGVFSMDGDICPLPGIVEAAEEHGAAVLIDDAHASGVLGDHGRGTVDHFGLHGRVAIQVGTLSKAVGVLGGYVAGAAPLRELLTQWARPFLFSTAHPPAVAAACIEAIKVMREEEDLFERLWANTRRFKAELARLGFDTGASETPITPILVGDAEAAIHFSTGSSRPACSRPPSSTPPCPWTEPGCARSSRRRTPTSTWTVRWRPWPGGAGAGPDRLTA